MNDPFALWSRMFSATIEMGRNAAQLSETLTSSSAVISQRTGMIGDAIRSPLNGDYAELGRMVPEKVEAFAKAGAAMAGECSSIQTAFLTEARHLGAMVLRGRPPTLSELATLSSRNTAYALQTMDNLVALGSGTLAPIHAKATSNARRLNRRA